jgi:serine/threonine-protein kinase
MTPAAVDPRLDTILDGRFRLVARLGAGGMGVVYRAVQLSVGREVALKVMNRRPAELAHEATNEATNERFLREARLASRLSHPAIVTTYDCGRTAAGELWIAMERLHGRSLRGLLEDAGALPLARALAIAEQVAAALASAHDAGVIHRDVKPSNVMIQGSDRAKLLDFGLARAGDDDSLTRSGVVCGTPAYLAPEVALGCPANERSDVYGLGLLLHEMITGVHPFAAATPEARVSRTLNEPPPRLTTVPDAVAEVVQRLLARTPADRCPSAAVAQQWISALRAGRSPALHRRPRRPLHVPWLALGGAALVAVSATVPLWLVHRPGATATVYRGSYTTSGNESCSRGRVWMRLDGDHLVGSSISDAGQVSESVGTYRPSGAVFGVFTIGEHPVGTFEGELRAGRARGTVSDHVYHCSGTFDLTAEP